MNERIQELLIEAHRQTKGGIYSGHPAEWSEKFAELIVKEVFAKIEDERFEVYEPVKEAVMKHFGIE